MVHRVELTLVATGASEVFRARACGNVVHHDTSTAVETDVGKARIASDEIEN